MILNRRPRLFTHLRSPRYFLDLAARRSYVNFSREQRASGLSARTKRHGMARSPIQRAEDPSGSTIPRATASRSSAFRAGTARITPTRHAAISWMPGRLLATADPVNETPLHVLARLTSPLHLQVTFSSHQGHALCCRSPKLIHSFRMMTRIPMISDLRRLSGWRTCFSVLELSDRI